MPAIRLLDTDGKTIGTVILDKEETEAEIVNTLPELLLDYSASLTNVHSFTLIVVPTDANDIGEKLYLQPPEIPIDDD